MSLRRSLAREDGMSLVDVLVGVVIMAVVMSIASSSAIHAMKVQRRQVAEVEAVGRARIAIERMTREIRAANPLLAASSDGTSITVQVTRLTTGWDRKLTTYSLVGDTIQVSGTLVNTATNATQAMPTTVLLRGVSLSAGERLFSYRMVDGTTPGPSSDLRLYRTATITLRMKMPEAATSVRVSDTVTLRNSAV